MSKEEMEDLSLIRQELNETLCRLFGNDEMIEFQAIIGKIPLDLVRQLLQRGQEISGMMKSLNWDIMTVVAGDSER
jgi:hypothetical protein